MARSVIHGNLPRAIYGNFQREIFKFSMTVLKLNNAVSILELMFIEPLFHDPIVLLNNITIE